MPADVERRSPCVFTNKSLEKGFYLMGKFLGRNQTCLAQPFLCFLGSVVDYRMLLLPVWHELTSSSQFSGSASHIAGTTGMYVCVYICIYCCVPGAGVICSK